MRRVFRCMRVFIIIQIGFYLIWAFLKDLDMGASAPLVPCLAKLFGGVFIFVWYWIANDPDR